MKRKETYVDLSDVEDGEGTTNMADYYFFRDGFTDEEIEKIKKIAMKYPAEVAGTGENETTRHEDSVR